MYFNKGDQLIWVGFYYLVQLLAPIQYVVVNYFDKEKGISREGKYNLFINIFHVVWSLWLIPSLHVSHVW